MKKRLIFLLCTSFLIFIACGTSSATNNTEYVSLSSDGVVANGNSYGSSVSSNGRFIAFTSDADNLVDNDTNGCGDVFVRDTVLNITHMVSISSMGTNANDYSNNPSISGDGRYVTFTSYATNLVANDNNCVSDIFIHDLFLRTTTRVSVSIEGEEANSDSYSSVINKNGSFIAFSSSASNLVENDTNGYYDIFLYDKIKNTIKRISISNNGIEVNGDSLEPTISDDGRYIAFSSFANNLVDGDNNGYCDVFIYDQICMITKRVSLSSYGDEANSDSGEPSISDDGRYIAFSSYADNLVSNDKYHQDIFVFDQVLNIIKKVSITSTGEELPNDCYEPSISGDGRYIVFTLGEIRPCIIFSDNFDSYDYTYYPMIFIRDMVLGTTEILSVSNSGEIAGSSTEPTINNDGRVVAFSSSSPSLSGNEDYLNEVYVRKFNLPTLSGIVMPKIAKTGDLITIKASSGTETTKITTEIFDEHYILTKQSDNTWILNYIISNIPSGDYPILLNAEDIYGNNISIKLYLSIDNTVPVLSGDISPNLVKSGDIININVRASPDTKSVIASLFGNEYELYNIEDDIWSVYCSVQSTTSEDYNVLITAIDNVGNFGTTLFKLTVDNTPPVILANISPDSFELINNILPIDNTAIIINASSDSDTVKIIVNNKYNMSQQPNGTWIFTSSFQELFYQIKHGANSFLLTAIDHLGNSGRKTLNLNLVNVNPTIKLNITPYVVKSGDFVEINVSFSHDPKKLWGYFIGYQDYNQGWISCEDEIPDWIKQEDGTWKTFYKIPKITDGICNIRLTIYYGEGIWSYNLPRGISSNIYGIFRSDNTPPIITPLNSTPIRSGDTLKIKAYSAVSRLEWNLWSDDTTSITATIFGRTLNMSKLWFKGSKSLWNADYVVPNLPDGYYGVYLTATDIVGNQMTTSTNFTVDNTPPTVTATLNPDNLKFIDFSSDRSLVISALSSSDTKAVYALVNNSWHTLSYSNGYWALNFGIRHIVNVGTYKIQLKAIDFAGNVGITSVSYTVYDNLGLGIGSGGSNGGSSGGSSGNNGSGSSSSGGSGDSSGGSNGDSSGGSSGNNGNGSSRTPSSPYALLFFIIMLFILVAIAMLFLVALFFGPELAIILAAIVSAASVASIPLDVWDIINYAYNLLFGHIDLIGTMLILLTLAGIILEVPFLLIIIGSIILFIFVAIILMRYLGS